MPSTRAQLVAKALSLLEEAGSGQSLDDGDKELVDAAVEPVAAELASRNVVVIGNINEIEDDIFLPLARVLANEVGEDFGRPYSEEYRLVQEARIRRVTTQRATYAPQEADYF